ncbi:MAG: flippase-like domain-containing protein [Bacteroidales bacterium]|nr:flippase-like domain-containing protein [Bacteroidales bacterium]
MKKLLLFIVFFALFAGMVYAADPHLLWQNLLQMRWTILMCAGVWGVGYLLNAVSFGTVLSIYPPKRPICSFEVLRLTIAGYAINYVTPFGLLGGEPYRVWCLRKYFSTENAASSVLLYSMMHICSHFLFWIIGCVMAVVLLPQIGWKLGIVLSVIVLLCVVAIVFFFRGYRSGLVLSIVQYLTYIPWIGKRIGRWQANRQHLLLQIDTGISNLLLKHPRRFWIALGMELLSRMINVIEVMILLRQMDIIPFESLYGAAYLVVAFSSLFANLLFFSPLQLGTREGGILLVLQQLVPTVGYAALLPVAVSISLATRLREFFWIGIGLLLTFIRK